MAKEKGFSWLFIGALVVVAFWVFSKLSGQSQPFTGVSAQRNLYGLDQFGNPITPGSGYAGQGILSS